METKGGKKKSTSSSSNSSLQYEAPLGHSIEDIRPSGGIEKFRSAAYSNITKNRRHKQPLNKSQIEETVLSKAQLDSILEPACCTIVSQLSNPNFDSYVLSESSLFVYPNKIILKTCGTTKLLLSIPHILQLSNSLSLTVSRVNYSRGTFIFPDHQQAPHSSFWEEVSALNEFFAGFTIGAYIIGDPKLPTRSWHVYSAVAKCSPPPSMEDQRGVITLEMCMTDLDREKAGVFYKHRNRSAREMTTKSGIADVIPGHVICDFEFDPCGYSMNGMEGFAYSTVHVTPEDGFSYASYEAMGLDVDDEAVKLGPLVKRVLACFCPNDFSVAVTCRGREARLWATEGTDVGGCTCRYMVKQELPAPGEGCVVYWTYCNNSTNGERCAVHPVPAKSSIQCWKEAAEEEEEVAVAVVCQCIPSA